MITKAKTIYLDDWGTRWTVQVAITDGKPMGVIIGKQLPFKKPKHWVVST